MDFHSSMDSYLLGCTARKSNMILVSVKCKTDNSLNTFSVLFGQNRVLVGELSGWEPSGGEEEERVEEHNRTEQRNKRLT